MLSIVGTTFSAIGTPHMGNKLFFWREVYRSLYGIAGRLHAFLRKEVFSMNHPTCCHCSERPAVIGDVCSVCCREPSTNNCVECGKHLEGICYPYVCGDCVRRELRNNPGGRVLDKESD